MKTLILITLSTVTLLASSITVEVKNISNSHGNVKIGLFNSAKDFLKIPKAYKNVSLKANGNLKYTFKDVPDGIYAISMYHDENSNGKIDRNFIGLPAEGHGLSNDAKAFMGPPKFKDAKFKLIGDKNIAIKMKY